MTKREFDRLTQQNWGGNWMASDERCGYKKARMKRRPGDVECFLARRARERIKHLPTLAIGQKWRNVAAYRAKMGLPMLENKVPAHRGCGAC